MLKPNKVKQKIASGEVQFGYLQAMPEPGITEILGHVGYDFVMLDGEHSPLLPAVMENLSRAAEVSDICPIVRVPGCHSQDICRLLDAGAAGIILPNVRRREEVEEAVNAARYLPAGTRGLAMPRQAGFGAMPMPEFVEYANDNLLMAVQIETPEALADIDNITAVEGVNVALLGPLDMSAALGVLGQFDHPLMVEARQSIVAACEKNGLTAGTFALAADQVKPLIDQGFKFILLGADLMFLRQSAAQILAAARET
ncbi:MAG: aldolase/citrate lyase family protein [Gammaproteobacteria bacterium]